jgi:hypothetical protein
MTTETEIDFERGGFHFPLVTCYVGNDDRDFLDAISARSWIMSRVQYVAGHFWSYRIYYCSGR